MWRDVLGRSQRRPLSVLSVNEAERLVYSLYRVQNIERGAPNSYGWSSFFQNSKWMFHLGLFESVKVSPVSGFEALHITFKKYRTDMLIPRWMMYVSQLLWKSLEYWKEHWILSKTLRLVCPLYNSWPVYMRRNHSVCMIFLIWKMGVTVCPTYIMSNIELRKIRPNIVTFSQICWVLQFVPKCTTSLTRSSNSVPLRKD